MGITWLLVKNAALGMLFLRLSRGLSKEHTTMMKDESSVSHWDQRQGEAQSAVLISEAIGNNPSFVTLRKIEASTEIAQMVAESQNRVLLNADELMLNVQAMWDYRPPLVWK